MILAWLFDRLHERSTWLAMFAVGGAFGFNLSPDQVTTIATLGTLLFVLPENNKKDNQK